MMRALLLVPATLCAELAVMHLTPVSGGWPAGASMAAMLRLAVGHVNAHPALLPNHTLVMPMVDDGCDGAVVEPKVLDQLLGDGTYDVLEVAGAYDELVPARGAGEFVGYLGPGCSGASKAIVRLATKARKPVVSHSATSPSLSNRASYPAFWRTIAPDTVCRP